MQMRYVRSVSMLFALLASAAIAVADAKGKDEGKSARDEQLSGEKESSKKGQDLGARVDALERQVRELVATLKGHKESGGDKAAAMKKSNPQDEADAIAAKNKMKAAMEAKMASDRKQPEKKPAVQKAIDDGPMVIKGKDGQLYVRLSALPEELRKKFGGGENEQAAELKHPDKKKPQKDDDDDHNQGKKPSQKDD
ncbi:hypothetical protein [Humisphaera borealis]|uniref:Uncharacterized protein n=1 Tax=Humisphaera borealis TaxID=2807512 RepID=A0A7M2WY37_9BACT|nr:hypothetical protein [Humisphaera borealis]QOV90386.1 hypothetical protein IPV69_03190 [Humisphaera borealis]